jgi:hypothetical protein
MSLEQFVERYHYIPAQTAVLGVCEDSMPVLFDLNDPQPGSLLVIAEQEAGKTNLLQTLLKLLVQYNSPEQVRFMLITNQMAKWGIMAGQYKRSGHCLSAWQAEQAGLAEAVFELADKIEKRAAGSESGPAVLLVIDDLSFVRQADLDLQLTLEWILKNGPQVGVWPLVSVRPDQAAAMGRWVSKFRTRIIGKMGAASSDRFGLYRGSGAERFFAGRQFAIWVQQKWLKFWLTAL